MIDLTQYKANQSPSAGDHPDERSVPPALDFELPPELEAGEPPEARGLSRDGVRLMVSYAADDQVQHTRFRALGEHLRAGDVLVLNTSGTRPAALNATRATGMPLELHLSTQLPARLWLVEARTPGPRGTTPFYDIVADETLHLPGGATATLHVPYAASDETPADGPARLWIATLRLPLTIDAYLARYGSPIRYGYVSRPWPIEYYQTVYATTPGSAEMPSAGRAFTHSMLNDLTERGVHIAPLVLHTGVSSLETHEPPYEEWYHVPLETARTVNTARAEGRRVIAVGTTVVRAVETATDEVGVAHPSEGWTRLVIAPERGMRIVSGLLTGFHEPQASHLAMLETLTGREHLRHVYAEALRERYLWHEFGDLHLLLP